MNFDLKAYVTQSGSSPYDEWFSSLDAVTARRVLQNVLRMAVGNFANCKPIESLQVRGVFERVMDFGPGYRVYYGLDGATVVLLLIGGTKRTQRRDIAKALSYWQDYNNRKESSNESSTGNSTR